MKNCKVVIFLFCLIALLVSCTPRRKKSANSQKVCKTGQAIADDHLIRKYESEHQKLCQENTREGDQLEWPALYKKDLSVYCRKYLQQSIPKRNIDNFTGIGIGKTLYYEKEKASITTEVFIVQCKDQATKSVSYYMTRAPEPNCVYALKCTRNKEKYTYTIIDKYCDFEDKPLRDRPLKRKRIEMIGKIHRETGQAIAKDENLLLYELEHKHLCKQIKEKSKCTEWPNAMVQRNLSSYCYKYLEKCVPNRKRDGVIGRLKIMQLHYQKLHSNKVMHVTAIQCLPHSLSKHRYHFTRSYDTNCVYALLRQGHSLHSPFVIIFKHCDFYDTNDQQPISSDHHDILDSKIIPKTKVKEESSDTMELLQLFPNY